jgi:hypothetical protein
MTAELAELASLLLPP